MFVCGMCFGGCYCTQYNNDRELSTLLWFTHRVSYSWAVKCITRFVSSKYDRCEYTKGYYICDKLVFSKNHESNNSTVLGGCGIVCIEHKDKTYIDCGCQYDSECSCSDSCWVSE